MLVILQMSDGGTVAAAGSDDSLAKTNVAKRVEAYNEALDKAFIQDNVDKVAKKGDVTPKRHCKHCLQCEDQRDAARA
jgi:hypothetical protein